MAVPKLKTHILIAPGDMNVGFNPNNNPYKFVDPDGQAAESVTDFISLGISVGLFAQDPSLANALGVLGDAIGTAVPFWAYLLVGGGHPIWEEAIESLVDPRQSEMEQIIEPRFTPAHTHPFEALLNQPFTGTFH